MTKTLKQRSLSALIWSLVDRSTQFVFLGVSIVMARMLSAPDYGMVAVLLIFSLLANAFQDSGFSSALIRKIDATEKDYNTIFYFNISVATLLYVVFFFCAPLIARYYGILELVPLSRFVFLTFFFNAFSMVQNVQLTKSLQYKKLAAVNIFATGTSYLGAILLVLSGWTYWAIAAQLVLLAFGRMVFLWIFNAWKPKLIFSTASFNELYKYSINLFLSNILGTGVAQIIPSLIGKFISITQSGYYYQAQRLNSVGVGMMDGTLSSVGFSVMSNIRDEDSGLLKQAFRKIVRLTAFIGFPVFIGTCLVAEPAIRVFLTDKWLPAVQTLQFLAVAAIFNSLNNTNVNLLRKTGGSKYILQFELIRSLSLLSLIALVLINHLDFVYILASISFVAFEIYCIYLRKITKLLNYKARELAKDVLPYGGIMLCAAAAAFVLRYAISSPLILLMAQVATAGTIYLALCYLLGSKLLRESLEVIKTKFFTKGKAELPIQDTDIS